MTVLFHSRILDPDAWIAGIKKADPSLEVRRWPELGDPARIECLLSSRPPKGLAQSLPNLKLLHLTGAGADLLLSDPELPQHLPIARIGDTARTRPQPWEGVAQPAPITSAVPSTGNSAALPGYSVVVPNRVQASRITPSPAHPVIAAARGASRRHCPAVRATRPPTASCQARVGSEKNATAGST